MQYLPDNTVIELIGTIISGRGTGGNRMAKLDSFFKENGVKIYPGTLNVIFSKPVVLDKSKADFAYHNKYFFWKIAINNIACYAYRWPNCPDHVIEVVADIKLRDKINIDSNQPVTISLSNSSIRKPHFVELLFWKLTWSGRTKAYYTNDLYAKLISKILNLKYRINQLFSVL